MRIAIKTGDRGRLRSTPRQVWRHAVEALSYVHGSDGSPPVVASSGGFLGDIAAQKGLREALVCVQQGVCWTYAELRRHWSSIFMPSSGNLGWLKASGSAESLPHGSARVHPLVRRAWRIDVRERHGGDECLPLHRPRPHRAAIGAALRCWADKASSQRPSIPWRCAAKF
jgi:hypothetical protein